MRWDGKGSAGGCGVQPLHAAVAQHHMMMGQTAGVRDEDGPVGGDAAVHRRLHDRRGIGRGLPHRRGVRGRAVWHRRHRLRVLQRAEGVESS